MKESHTMPIGKTAASAVKRISMNPSEFTAGGLIDDVDITITDALTTLFDFNGSQPPTPCLALELTDPNKVAHIQYFSAGKPEDWQPDDAGEGLVAVSGKTSINNSTNLGKFLASLVEAGYPSENLNDGNLKVLIGLQAHVIQQVVERKGLVRTGKNADRPNTVLVVSKIIALPGAGGGVGASAASATSKATGAAGASGAVGGKSNGAAKTTPAASPAAAGGEDELDAEISSALQAALLEAEGNTLAKKDVTKVVFAAFAPPSHTPTERNKAVIRAGKQDFLTGLAELGITYDGATLALAQ
jgi:hypothetical protein